MPGNRDPFAAFLCDEAALEVLRPVVIEMGWQPEKCNKGGLRNAVQSLSITASPNILMVDLSESLSTQRCSLVLAAGRDCDRQSGGGLGVGVGDGFILGFMPLWHSRWHCRPSS